MSDGRLTTSRAAMVDRDTEEVLAEIEWRHVRDWTICIAGFHNNTGMCIKGGGYIVPTVNAKSANQSKHTRERRNAKPSHSGGNGTGG